MARAIPPAMLALAAACTRGEIGRDAIAGKTPDGTVEMRQVQAAYLASAGGGSGALRYRGRTYPFHVRGLGVGGIGASTIEAEGEVYNLPDVLQFPGRYAQARYGLALGRASAGEMWLQNGSGVILRLQAKREGLMLSLGGDAVLISMASDDRRA